MTRLRNSPSMTEKNTLYYEQIGADFDNWISDYDTDRRKVLIFKKLLGECLQDRDVLEVGCGTGRITQALSEAGARVTVNDISDELTKKVAQAYSCHTLFGDVAEMTEEPGRFDVVVSSEVVEHTVQPYAFLGGLGRLVKPGGVLVLTTPNKLWYPVLMLAQTLKIRKFQGIENWLWPVEARAALESQGFQVEQLSGCHLFPWQIPGAKSVLPLLDRFGDKLYPLMINFGLRARKLS